MPMLKDKYKTEFVDAENCCATTHAYAKNDALDKVDAFRLLCYCYDSCFDTADCSKAAWMTLSCCSAPTRRTLIGGKEYMRVNDYGGGEHLEEDNTYLCRAIAFSPCLCVAYMSSLPNAIKKGRAMKDDYEHTQDPIDKGSKKTTRIVAQQQMY